MAEKRKVTFPVRIDENLYRKMTVVAERENSTLNNYILKLVRTNVEYSERVHGRIDASKVALPDDGFDDTVR